MLQSFSEIVISIIKQIPKGKVATYGLIAKLSGNSKASRQISFILNSCSEKYNLPWYRVINSKGQISLKKNYGYELQKELLENEGVVFDEKDCVDLNKYLWQD